MTAEASGRRRSGPPLAVQMISLLAVGWLVTLMAAAGIVMLLPPPARAVYRLTELSAALRGGPLASGGGRSLRRLHRSEPPPAGEARLSSGVYRLALASALGIQVSRVRVERYPVSDPVRRSLLRVLLVGPPSNMAPPGAYGGTLLTPGADMWTAPPRALSAASPPPSRTASEPPLPTSDGLMPPPEGRPLIDRLPPLFGRFSVALQEPSGRWTVVEPKPELFPNPWQSRLLLWFVACLSVLTPVGYLSARRLASPLALFAQAAERLGRDPNAPPIEVSGPAEIGQAAAAFNEMQARLKRYVEHRTSAIGAIAHDLRTPLARIRFKIEALPARTREPISRDVIQMEQMIAAALAFVRDTFATRPREALDLKSAVECVVDNTALMGADAKVTSAECLVILGDALALDSLFTNVIGNAVKYGRRARVRIYREDGSAVVDVADNGPGLPEAELEKVFEPFYRVESSRNPETGGMGLGLATARAVARGHGGDITLLRARQGLIARVRLPLALQEPPAAAPAGAGQTVEAIGPTQGRPQGADLIRD